MRTLMSRIGQERICTADIAPRLGDAQHAPKFLRPKFGVLLRPRSDIVPFAIGPLAFLLTRGDPRKLAFLEFTLVSKALSAARDLPIG